MHPWLAMVGALAVATALMSERIREWPVSEPLLALVAGVLAGPRVLGWLDLGDHELTAVVLESARLLLAVSLMAVALRYAPSELRRRAAASAAAVGIVMPIMALVSAVLGAWILGASMSLAWLLGAILSPTDPVLASAVVTGGPAEATVPERLRHVLSLESGANDGLALPLVVLGIAAVQGEALSGALIHSLWAVGGALVVGVVIGVTVGRGMTWARAHHDVAQSVMTVFTLLLALFTVGVAKVVGTDGLLAVFVAGLAYNVSVTGAERRPEVSVDEAVNRFAVLPVFALLGVVLPWQAWGTLGWPLAAFVVAVLLLRRLPAVALMSRPLRFDWPEVGFYGWFGPMGASSLFYVAHARHEGVDDPILWPAATAVIAASVVAHGLTTMPGRRLYARAAEDRRAGVA